MATALVVPDASVILKWVLPPTDEADVGRGVALRDAIGNGDVQALVPKLWLNEVGNALARRLPPSRAAAGEPRALRPAHGPLSRRWLNQALDLTQRCRVTFYDAAHHAHAILERGVFVTADERYFRHAREARTIVWLAEWRNR